MNKNMDRQIWAILIQEGGRFASGLLSLRTPKGKISEEHRTPAPAPAELEELTEESKAASIEAGCVPCAIGHLGTCTGLLNEAVRFAKKDGIESSEVIDRVNICLDELNALERVDLRSELITNLPPWEKELADKALNHSRDTRHGLESLTSVGALEKVTASTQSTRQEIGREWFQQRLARMTPEDKRKLEQRVEEELKESAVGMPENAG